MSRPYEHDMSKSYTPGTVYGQATSPGRRYMSDGEGSSKTDAEQEEEEENSQIEVSLKPQFDYYHTYFDDDQMAPPSDHFKLQN